MNFSIAGYIECLWVLNVRASSTRSLNQAECPATSIAISVRPVVVKSRAETLGRDSERSCSRKRIHTRIAVTALYMKGHCHIGHVLDLKNTLISSVCPGDSHASEDGSAGKKARRRSDRIESQLGARFSEFLV